MQQNPALIEVCNVYINFNFIFYLLSQMYKKHNSMARLFMTYKQLSISIV